jgi:DNA-binding NarL/FixJ family response regulator
MGKIRVALAEDHVLLREGISRLVAANEDFELVGAASDLPQLLALVAEQVPDVVVTDIRMPPTGTDEGIKAAAWIRQNHPRVAVVVLSQFTAPGYALALLEHGSSGRGYLLKERIGSVDELARAIRTVAQGGSMIDPLVVDELLPDEVAAEAFFGHAAADYAIGLGRRAGARRVLLTHHKPGRTDDELDRLAARVAAGPVPVTVAAEGQVIEL